MLAVPATTLGQGPGILGTPPPEGYTIEEVATAVESGGEFWQFEWDCDPCDYSFVVALPLPVFPSAGVSAGPSECLWTFSPVWLRTDNTVGIDYAAFSYTLEGRNLTVDISMEGHPIPGSTWDFHYEITAVAVRTTPPAPVQSKSLGAIKAMFREE